MMNQDKKGKPTPLWKALLLEHRLPRRYKYLGDFCNVVILIPLRRMCFSWVSFLHNFNAKEDITVVIAVKNRYDHRIKNALKSIRNQEYEQSLIKIILVDSDSQRDLIPKFKKLCKKYDASYIRINNKPIWHKTHALNVGIKKTKTKYLLSSDIDIIFEKNYFKEAIKELRKNPYQVIVSQMLDLPKRASKEKQFNKLKAIAKSRLKDCPVSGINLTLTYFYHKIHGYDEYYQIWAAEDDDLIKRFILFGLNRKMQDKSSYLHQWHPRYEGVKIPNYKKYIKENKKYLTNNYSIVRNKNGWGEIN